MATRDLRAQLQTMVGWREDYGENLVNTVKPQSLHETRDGGGWRWGGRDGVEGERIS